jgi:hypothetical protein
MTYYLDILNRYKEFLELTGGIEEVTPEEARSLSPNLVWSQRWPNMEIFLTKGFSDEDGEDGYFKANLSWDDSTPDYIVTSVWFDCEDCQDLEDEDSECLTCSGSGSRSISFEDCLEASTEEEILAEIS